MSRPDSATMSDADRAVAIEKAERLIEALERSLGDLEEYAERLERGEE